jgi:biopolymer transport protein ExbD
MRRRRLNTAGEAHAEEGGINLTPLIDVVFVVLIMFIIVAPLLEIDKVELARAAQSPHRGGHPLVDGSQIAIHVRRDNTVWLNSARLSFEQLSAALRRAKQQHPGQVPQLFHDRQAFFETYQTVKNAVEAAGFDEMDVVLQPE